MDGFSSFSLSTVNTLQFVTAWRDSSVGVCVWEGVGRWSVCRHARLHRFKSHWARLLLNFTKNYSSFGKEDHNLNQKKSKQGALENVLVKEREQTNEEQTQLRCWLCSRVLLKKMQLAKKSLLFATLLWTLDFCID